jgi:hypothetical protein
VWGARACALKAPVCDGLRVLDGEADDPPHGGSVVALRLRDEHRLLALGALEHLRLKDGHHEGHGALAAIASGCRRLGRARVRLIRAHDVLRVWDRTRGCVALPQAVLTPAVLALAGYGKHPAAALPRSLADLEFT